MTWITLTRLIVLSVSILFSLICLALGAHIIATGTNLSTEDIFGDVFAESVYWPFSGLAVAVSVINLVTIGPMLVIVHLRNDAYASLIIVEIVWLSVMSVLWLATGALAANTTQFCSGSQFFVCTEGAAIAAFGFLTWLCLMGYSMTLLALSVIAHNRRRRIWMLPVKESLDVSSASPAEQKPVHMEDIQTPVPVQVYAPVTPSMKSRSSTGAYAPSPLNAQRSMAAEV